MFIYIKKLFKKSSFLYTALFLAFFTIYFLTSAGNTPYNYFTRLADAFIHGRYWLTENPPWLNELIPAGTNKFFVPYSPMPAILSLPFVFIFGKDLPQQLIAHLLGAAIAILAMKMSQDIKKNKILGLWSALLVGLGSIVWFMSATGSSWYLGQITAAFFLMAAIAESLGKKRALLVGIFLGGAYMSRLHTILSLPFFLYIFRKNKTTNFTRLFAGVVPFILINSLYNYLRFGVPWDKGYSLIPGLFNEPWYEKGLFNPLYVPNHLKIIFTALPIFKNQPPFVQPSWGGLAIWLTTPAFIYAFFNSLKNKLVLFSWLAIIFIALVVFSHGSTGFTQFGYRFAVDFYPFLILLTIKRVAKTGLKWHHWLLLVIGIIVNLWGVLWINKFGWVSY
jgi:hypothetical protein